MKPLEVIDQYGSCDFIPSEMMTQNRNPMDPLPKKASKQQSGPVTSKEGP